MDTISIPRETLENIIQGLSDARDYADKCQWHDFLTPVPDDVVTYPSAVGRFNATTGSHIMRLQMFLDRPNTDTPF